MTLTQVPHHLASIRADKGLTQTAVADKLGIAQNTLSMYEQGRRPVTLEMAERWAEALGVDITVQASDGWVEVDVDEHDQAQGIRRWHHEDTGTLLQHTGNGMWSWSMNGAVWLPIKAHHAGPADAKRVALAGYRAHSRGSDAP